MFPFLPSFPPPFLCKLERVQKSGPGINCSYIFAPPPLPTLRQTSLVCPAVGQRPLSVAQIVDRLRSGSAAGAAEACVALDLVESQCNFMARVGKPLRCPPLAIVAVAAGLIPFLVGLLASGGVAAFWACMALKRTCTVRRWGGATDDVHEGVEAARAAFVAAGGVESAVELLALPLRHPGLAGLSSICLAVRFVTELLFAMECDSGCDRAFKIRLIDAGLVPPLVRNLAREGPGSFLALGSGQGPDISPFIAQLCLRTELRDGNESPMVAIPCIVVALVNCGIAPIVVAQLRLPGG